MVERWSVTIAPDMDEVREFSSTFGGTAPAVTGYGHTPEQALEQARALIDLWCDGAAALAAAWQQRGATRSSSDTG